MAQPTFVPVPDADRVRPSIPPPIPTRARTGRPGELRGPFAPTGRGVGTTGPDQGYALLLAHRLADALHLVPGEDPHDVSLGVALLGARRASLAGRAPCAYDLQVAAGLFGYLTDAPADLVAFRQPLFKGLAHRYDQQRALIDAVPADALQLAPAAVADATTWRHRLIVTEEAP